MWLLLSSFASSPEICDGLDNDVDGVIDNGAVCGPSSLVDSSTGHAYTVRPAGTGVFRDWACSDIGYHPADPNSAAENALLAAFADGNEYWMGIQVGELGGFVDSAGQPISYTAWTTTPSTFDGCSLIGDTDSNGVMEWRWVDATACENQSYGYLCEADCVLTTLYEDLDGDGYGDGPAVSACGPTVPGYAAVSGDCDDFEPDDNPEADELCDGRDNDCDNDIDEDAVDAPLWYLDDDDDGAGDPATGIASCTALLGRIDVGGDCAPADPLIHPLAPEACTDGIDNDCDLLVDDEDPDFEAGGVLFWLDSDGDGFGIPGVEYTGCSGTQPAGYVSASNGEDCDDADDANAPGFVEQCDGQDNNCDILVDNGLNFLDYWPDDDGDGFGDESAASTNACTQPAGWVRNQLDCDDSDPHTSPETDEVCDGFDNDCNGHIDDGLPTTDYWPDADDDGYGDQSASAQAACEQPAGTVTDATDCDDTDGHIHPGATDDPDDGIDSDCDGTVEQPPVEPLVDTDGDGIPDTIDPTPDGHTPAAGPEPSPADYGCGCATTAPSFWFGVIRR